MYKIGDKVICKCLSSFVGFKIGNKYIISYYNLNTYYGISDSKGIKYGIYTNELMNKYFYTNKELRKLKLERLGNEDR